MRKDAIGLFWEDVPKEHIKPIPPERVWEREGFLPYIEEARAFTGPFFTEQSLYQAMIAKDVLMFDVECYPNYFLVSFMSYLTGQVIQLEKRAGVELDTNLLKWLLQSFKCVSFNGNNYDAPVIAIALTGATCEQLYEVTDRIINQRERKHFTLKHFHAKALVFDHVDLIELTPPDKENGFRHISLKTCAGRLHAPRLQDLPYVPGTILSDDQITVVKYYNINDLIDTAFLYTEVEDKIKLREELGKQYGGLDLRSKSDAQIAETVIRQEIENLKGSKIFQPKVKEGEVLKYNVPSFLQFQTPLLQSLLNDARNAEFVVKENGKLEKAELLAKYSKPGIVIGNSRFVLQNGGLHSTESKVSNFATEEFILSDRDVTSYYPSIILNLGLFPEQLGIEFLEVFRRIVEDRINAKKLGNKIVTDTLKIVINGTFGKLGSSWSILYSPQLLIQVTLTGQLALLMLIEALELSGITVVSANTDGIVVRCHKEKIELFDTIVHWWEDVTHFNMEEHRYSSIHNRDVNAYVAIQTDGEAKGKGVFAKMGLTKTPTNQIVSEAVSKFITQKIPLESTIISCTDIRKFVTVRNVRGGGVKNGEYLGKVVRWYYGDDKEGCIIYADSGHLVPCSEGATPCQDLPKSFPADLDKNRYIQEAYKLMEEIGLAV